MLTTYTGQRDWGTEREHWPAVLKQYEPRCNDRRKPKPGLWITLEGQVVLDINDNAILAYAELPATISSEIEPEFLIAFHRLNHNITMPDIRARMLRHPTGKRSRQGVDGDPIRTGNLSMRMTRCREKAGMFSWQKRVGSSDIKAYIDALLPQRCRDENSIANFRDLYPHEIAGMRLVLVGKHPERTRGKKDYSTQKEDRLYQEQLRRYRSLKAKFDEDQRLRQDQLNRRKRSHVEDDTESDSSDISGAPAPQRKKYRTRYSQVETPRQRLVLQNSNRQPKLDTSAVQANQHYSQTMMGANQGLVHTQSNSNTSNIIDEISESQPKELARGNHPALVASCYKEEADRSPSILCMTSDDEFKSFSNEPSPEMSRWTDRSVSYFANHTSPYFNHPVQAVSDNESHEIATSYPELDHRSGAVLSSNSQHARSDLDNEVLLQTARQELTKRKRRDDSDSNPSIGATLEETNSVSKRRKSDTMCNHLVIPNLKQGTKHIAGLLASSLDPALFLSESTLNQGTENCSEQREPELWYTPAEPQHNASHDDDSFTTLDAFGWIQYPEIGPGLEFPPSSLNGTVNPALLDNSSILFPSTIPNSPTLPGLAQMPGSFTPAMSPRSSSTTTSILSSTESVTLEDSDGSELISAADYDGLVDFDT